MPRICPPIPSFKKECNVVLPFSGLLLPGIDLSDQIINFSADDQAKDTINRDKQIASMLSPFMAIFKVIEAVQSIFEIAKSIPDAITSLDPTAVTDKINDAQDSMNDLLNILPQLSIPQFLKDFISCVIALLKACQNTLYQVQQLIIDAQNLLDSITEQDPPELIYEYQCNLTQNQSAANNAIDGIKQLNPILVTIGTANALLGLSGSVPNFEEMTSDDIGGAVQILENAINALESIRDLIP